MTPERLAEIASRFEAAYPKVDRGGEELKMTFSKANEKEWHSTIWYPDGDECATIHSSLGLDVDGDALARFWANAWLDVRDLIKAVKDLASVAQ